MKFKFIFYTIAIAIFGMPLLLLNVKAAVATIASNTIIIPSNVENGEAFLGSFECINNGATNFIDHFLTVTFTQNAGGAALDMAAVESVLLTHDDTILTGVITETSNNTYKVNTATALPLSINQTTTIGVEFLPTLPQGVTSSAFEISVTCSGIYNEPVQGGGGGGGGEEVVVVSPPDNTPVDVETPTESSTAPIHRFWSNTLGAHFFTQSDEAKNDILLKWPHIWTYEGPKFKAGIYNEASGTCSEGNPIYQFWSNILQVHFYAESLAIKEETQQKWPDIWNYEKIAFCASSVQAAGTVPVYRLWSESLGAHFYTINDSDLTEIPTKWPGVWAFEGAKFYAKPL